MTDAAPAEPTPEDDPTYGEIVWGQFRKRGLAYGAMWGVFGLFALAIACPLIASNKPFLWIVSGEGVQFPWFSALFDRNFYENSVDIFFNALLFPGVPLLLGGIWWWRRSPADQRLRRSGMLAGVWVVLFALIMAFPMRSPKQVFPRMQEQLEAQGESVTAIYAPLPYSPRDFDLGASRAGISWTHPLGTDNAGRDVITRLLYGTRISLTIGIFAVLLYCTVGTIVGSIAGFYGGWVDIAILRVIEVVMAIPSLFLILALAAFIENRSIFHIMLIIAAVAWTRPARLVRGEFLRLRQLDFVSSARAAGFKERTIIFREILPNALGPVLVNATFGVASAILVESTISFLGLGDITVPSWGQILNTGRTTGIWTLILAPGFAIFVTVGLLNLVGEGVRDAMDPKMRM